MGVFRSKDQRGSFYKSSRDSSVKYYYSTQNRASRLRALRLAKKALVKENVGKKKS